VTGTASNRRLFYHWQKEFFENAAAAFEPCPKCTANANERRIAFLEQKLQRKHEVLSKLMDEYIKLKKSLENFEWGVGFSTDPRFHHRVYQPLGQLNWSFSYPVGWVAGNRLEQV
jgi:hypothetical protein